MAAAVVPEIYLYHGSELDGLTFVKRVVPAAFRNIWTKLISLTEDRDTDFWSYSEAEKNAFVRQYCVKQNADIKKESDKLTYDSYDDFIYDETLKTLRASVTRDLLDHPELTPVDTVEASIWGLASAKSLAEFEHKFYAIVWFWAKQSLRAHITNYLQLDDVNMWGSVRDLVRSTLASYSTAIHRDAVVAIAPGETRDMFASSATGSVGPK